MSTSELTRVITVRTADGVTTEHSFELTQDYSESAVVERITAALDGRSKRLLLTNPIVVYSASQIVAIAFDWSLNESGQLQDENEKAALRQETERRAIGFLQGR